MTRENIPDAKNRILQAAVKVFAIKSFEGSRIEEIATEANVPKSLIYYHFKSKDEILSVLTQNFIKEYTELLQVAKNDTPQSKAENMQARLKSVYYEFGVKNADLVRVLFIDSLKKSEKPPILFKMLDAMIETERSFMQNTDATYDLQERRVAEFFTSFIPNYAYICFADAWTNYYEIDRKQFNSFYGTVLEQTHGAYHKNHQ